MEKVPQQKQRDPRRVFAVRPGGGALLRLTTPPGSGRARRPPGSALPHPSCTLAYQILAGLTPTGEAARSASRLAGQQGDRLWVWGACAPGEGANLARPRHPCFPPAREEAGARRPVPAVPTGARRCLRGSELRTVPSACGGLGKETGTRGLAGGALSGRRPGGCDGQIAYAGRAWPLLVNSDSHRCLQSDHDLSAIVCLFLQSFGCHTRDGRVGRKCK